MFKVRTALKKDAVFNPFNPQYNEDTIYKKIKEAEKEFIFDKGAFLIAGSTPIFNGLFVSFYAHLDKVINQNNMSFQDMKKYIIAIANRDYAIVKGKYKSHFEKKGKYDFDEVNHLRINAGHPSLENINASAGVEASIDSAAVILNFLRNRDERTVSESSDEMLGQLINLYAYASYYLVIKEAYDSAVWENGFIIPNDRKDLEINPRDSLYPKIKNIGVIRLLQNTLLFQLRGYQFLKKNSILYKLYLDQRSVKLKGQLINSLKINNGEVKICLKKKKDLLIDQYFMNKAEI